jgi:transposase-like protein
LADRLQRWKLVGVILSVSASSAPAGYRFPREVIAVDQHGQVIDVLVSQRRGARAARAFFTRALTHGPSPFEVTTDRAPVYPRVIDELVPAARHVTEQYSNNSVEADHGRLKARLRPMRGMKTISSLRVIAAGHALVQNLRRPRQG